MAQRVGPPAHDGTTAVGGGEQRGDPRQVPAGSSRGATRVTTRIVTDSNAQFPDELAARYGVEVVPLQVSVDGESLRRGHRADRRRLLRAVRRRRHARRSRRANPARGPSSRPTRASPTEGATDILSIHIGSDLSGTLNSARLAAQSVEVAVRLVDTATASFGVSCCVWEAAEALRAGASPEDAAIVAESVASTVGNVFVVGALDLARSGGRMRIDHDPGDAAGIPVLSLVDGEIEVVGTASRRRCLRRGHGRGRASVGDGAPGRGRNRRSRGSRSGGRTRSRARRPPTRSSRWCAIGSARAWAPTRVLAPRAPSSGRRPPDRSISVRAPQRGPEARSRRRGPLPARRPRTRPTPGRPPPRHRVRDPRRHRPAHRCAPSPMPR